MITSADPGKTIFLSVDPKDGSMEAFDEIQEAVARATDLIKDQNIERLIFVAMPRARVRMAVRVEPIDPPPRTTPEPAESPRDGDWEKSQGLDRDASRPARLLQTAA